jgi:hypothetical protein
VLKIAADSALVPTTLNCHWRLTLYGPHGVIS